MLQMNVSVAAESDEPTIETFTTGSQTSLGLDKEHSGNKWYLAVNKTQDYENPNQRYYRFNVAAGTQKHDVALSIINVDDESPYFNLPDSASCQIKVSNALKLHSLHTYRSSLIHSSNQNVNECYKFLDVLNTEFCLEISFPNKLFTVGAEKM
jgi:lipopolysaccharide assembly outer membrane protein LptD (OstA)